MSESERMENPGRLLHGPAEAGPWYTWGPYLSERAWGTVREDYSADGDAWGSFPYDHSNARAYRWNEDGLAGLSNIWQDLCVGLALWNGRDPHVKERLFGLTGPEGNHGEDVKEYWWYRGATPSHSWLSWRYHYPQGEFPYEDLRRVNASRGRLDPEYELLDTGIFEEDRYWVVDVDYAKAEPTDISMRIRITNAGPDTETLHVMPQAWYRNTWSWGGLLEDKPPVLMDANGVIRAEHWRLGVYDFAAAPGPDGVAPQALFCDNATNDQAIWGHTSESSSKYPKDGINNHIIHGAETVNPMKQGTKAAWWYKVTVEPGETVELRLRLWSPSEGDTTHPGWQNTDFDELMATREREANEFYASLAPVDTPPAAVHVMQQAFAGMVWGKQFYRYDVDRWLEGDEGEMPPPPGHDAVRNRKWTHLDAYDVISMPDPWEYPWFAAWDLAFHTVVFAHIDPEWSKYQLMLMLREWYMHPNGAIPAYEWSFDDRNPPVHAWAALRVFEISGGTDYDFLERIFHKLLMNFTWWVNRVDAEDNNVFQGGFLGLDNIGPIDRSHVPEGYQVDQADGTAWMAFYCLMMLRISLRLSATNKVYQSMSTKFLEHFVDITDGVTATGMWDPADGFFYDQLIRPDGERVPLRVKSLVGLMPIMAAASLTGGRAGDLNAERLQRRWELFLHRRRVSEDPSKAGFVSMVGGSPLQGGRMLLSIVDPERLKRVLAEALSEESMLSDYGIRSLSKRHQDNPFSVNVNGHEFRIDYEPAESQSPIYGGNSNWRGPVWFPINHLFIEVLERYFLYFGAEFTVECPTGSGVMMNLQEVADELRRRLLALFIPDENGYRPYYGRDQKFADDPRWQGDVMFFEYFDADTGAGLGASHQTGWTGLIADLIIGRKG
ncbi:MAG: glucosidase [Actinobacteria bacterium]|nr:glucosidase [Actinomycetota bacterium]